MSDEILYICKILLDIVSYPFVAYVLMLMGIRLFAVPFSWRRVGMGTLIMCAMRLAAYATFGLGVLPYLFSISIYILIPLLVFRLRGWKLLQAGLLTGMMIMFMDIVIQAIALSFFTFDELFIPSQGPIPVLIRPNMLLIVEVIYIVAPFCSLGVFLALHYFWRLLQRKWRREWLGVIRVVVVLALAGYAIFFQAIEYDRQTLQITAHSTEQFIEITWKFVVPLVSMGLLLFYIIQDLRTQMLTRQNNSLTQQQSAYDALLTDVRVFRHNIANMLYGFEGKILSGNVEEIRGYYEQMARECARINNENAVALGYIRNGAASALLLNKIRAANEEKIPIYVTVEERLSWRGLRDRDMCQLLGALIDNAIEATRGAATPYVAIEICNVAGDMEIIIRNTFEDGADLGFLTGALKSTKEGHDGLGLSSVQGILKENKNVIMNQIQRGRYVETMLLF